jgi:hypothetical protein
LGEEDVKEKDFMKRYFDFYEKREYNEMIFSNKKNSLVSFFLQLSRYLQQAIGTIPAIDLNEYSKAINFTIDEEL